MITTEQTKGLIYAPTFSPLVFDIPNSIDGSIRKATFLKLEYFTADNLPPEVKKQTSFLKVSFHVKCYLRTLEEQDDIITYDENEEEVRTPQEPLVIDREIIGRDFFEEFIADYKTIVNALNGGEVIISGTSGSSINYDVLKDYINDLIENEVYTEEQVLSGQMSSHLFVNQITFFEMLFNDENNGGYIPVKGMIQSFALNANWGDIEVI